MDPKPMLGVLIREVKKEIHRKESPREDLEREDDCLTSQGEKPQMKPTLDNTLILDIQLPEL
jgi:hypothetical protein